MAYYAIAQGESCCEHHAGGFRFDGATVLNDFISEEEEKTLIEKIDESPWLPSQSGRNKQVLSRPFFGVRYILLCPNFLK